MAQFSFLNDLNSAVRMDDPLTRGPAPRWQKKGLENSSNNINVSLNASKTFTSNLSKTPKKHGTAELAHQRKTPSKTPSKTPRKSPRSMPGTPSGGDRFIPVRSASNFDLCHFQMAQQQCEEPSSPSLAETQKVMAENLHGRDINNYRVLAFQKKAPAPPEGFTNPLKVVYSQSKTPASTKGASRYIPQAPDRILDAPEIIDDYYLNLIDWSSNNILAVALGSSVYLWNATTGTIDQLMELEGTDYVCSLNWIQEGNLLAVGTFNGPVQLWDTAESKRIRVMTAHATRVGSLAWNAHILSSGARSGTIIHHDVRQRDHAVATLSAHSQEVCGLKWSPDGKYLASGGNDNMLNIWAQAPGQVYSLPQPLYSFSAHQAAVKAVAWCPWQTNLLASGGGTADRHIRFWNCNTGACVNAIDTKSQVCALLWSANYKEIVSGHGYANNQLIIWKYPAITKTAELTGHTARVLHLAMSPDGTTVLSAGADETLRMWKCFMVDPSKRKDPAESKAVTSILKKGIR